MRFTERIGKLEGVSFGVIGLVAFSGTLPATKLAVPAFGAVGVTAGRVLVAASLAAILLFLSRALWPTRAQLLPLAAMGLGLAVGFPFFMALGLATASSVHGAVIAGFTPSATAALSVLRNRERPRPLFWLGCIGALVAVVIYVLAAGAGFTVADTYFAVAILCSSVAYVEGARLSREIGAYKTLSWSLLLVAPIAAAFVIVDGLHYNCAISAIAWAGFAWVSLISMFFGSIAWYRGLQIGGTARISQLLVLQPLVTIGISRYVVREPVTPHDVVYACVVIACVAICLRSKSP